MRKTLFLTTLATSLVSVGVLAAPDATLNFVGSINPNTCTLDAADVAKAVTLTDTDGSKLSGGVDIRATTFSFNLTACDSTITSAMVTMDGAMENSNSGGYTKVLKNTGTAGNVGIGLLGASSTESSPRGPLPVGVPSASSPVVNNTVTLSLGAAIVALDDAQPSTAGTVVGAATATITYS